MYLVDLTRFHHRVDDLIHKYARLFLEPFFSLPLRTETRVTNVEFKLGGVEVGRLGVNWVKVELDDRRKLVACLEAFRFMVGFVGLYGECFESRIHFSN